MSKLINHLYSPNLISICVDHREDGDFGGEVWDFYHEEPHSFDRAMELVMYVDGFMDEINFPQSANRPRTFRKTGTVQRARRKSFHKDKIRTMDNLEEKQGNLGTFIVQVKYRQNSTWQGQVVWAEEDKKVYFRSALELLRLIDDATAGKAAPEKNSGWED